MAITVAGHNIRDVYCFFKITTSPQQHQPFKINNWIDYNQCINQSLNKIYSKNGAIWLNSKGDISYRLSSKGNIHTAVPEKASIVLSNFLQEDIHIRKKFKLSTSAIPRYPSADPYILTNNLLLIENEEVNFFQPSEFFQGENNLLYRNTYRPTFYMLPSIYQQIQPSIILQFIYYLSNYNEARFKWILHWLAAFFQNFTLKSPIPLVLIGEKESGMDILFEEIIKPLFGYEYCVKITDDHLRLGNLSSSFQNKLFYNLDNISSKIIDDAKSNKLLFDMISKRTVFIDERKSSSNDINIFGQILITVDTPYLPYLDNSYNSYTVFKVLGSLENIFHPTWSVASSNTPFSKQDFINTIRNDLINFSNILKSCSTTTTLNQFQNDDKNLILINIDDKFKAFYDAIMNMDTTYFAILKGNHQVLYEEILKDFEAKKIKQVNLIKCFNSIYPEEHLSSSRTLMSKLRKINNVFFKTESISTGTGGVKYFNCRNPE